MKAGPRGMRWVWGLALLVRLLFWAAIVAAVVILAPGVWS